MTMVNVLSTKPDIEASRPIPIKSEVSPISSVETDKNDDGFNIKSKLISGTTSYHDDIREEPETIIPTNDNDKVSFKKLELVSASSESPIKYLDGDSKTGEVSVGFIDETDFIEFWCYDAWDALATVLAIIGIEATGLRTEEDEREEASKAGARLYRIAKRHPKYLGWMVSDTVLEGGDFMVCALFFGGKFAAVYKGWKKSKIGKKKTPAKKVSSDKQEDWSEPVCNEVDDAQEI